LPFGVIRVDRSVLKLRHKWVKVLSVVLLIVICMPFYKTGASTGEDIKFIDDILTTEHGTVMLIIDAQTGAIVEANKAAAYFYGYEPEVLKTMNISEINQLTPGEVKEEMAHAVAEERNYFEFKHLLSDGSVRDVVVYSYPGEMNGRQYLYSIIHDVTDQVEAEAKYEHAVRLQMLISSMMILALVLTVTLLFLALRRGKETQKLLEESEDNYAYLFDNIHEGYALHEILLDDEGKPCDYRFLRMNNSFEIYTGLVAEEILGKRVLEVMPEIESYWIESYGKVALEGESIHLDNYASELGRYYSVDAYQAGVGRFITVFVDVTETKLKEKEIIYLNFHDQLTELYNRRYMEEEMALLDQPQYLPFSMIMADINGLKLANDAFGHSQGDALLKAAAETFRSVFREEDSICRVGGDEFVILLPNTSKNLVQPMINRLMNQIEETIVGPLPLSISLGDATKDSMSQKIQLIYKQAEDRMYHQKLTKSQKTRSSMVHFIFRKMEIELESIHLHQQRVSSLAGRTANIFHLTSDQKGLLVEAALYHDVGFAAIDMTIPNKEGLLDDHEVTEVQRHSECGYRILSAISEYAEIADLILEHHEWYDGSGYPKNLRGNGIHQLSRILSVLDAFDAMTHERAYEDTFDEGEAIEELRKCSGSQFDPEIVEAFIKWLEEKA